MPSAVGSPFCAGGRFSAAALPSSTGGEGDEGGFAGAVAVAVALRAAGDFFLPLQGEGEAGGKGAVQRRRVGAGKAVDFHFGQGGLPNPMTAEGRHQTTCGHAVRKNAFIGLFEGIFI